MRRPIRLLERTNKVFWVITGIAFLFTVAIGDYITGTELSFSLFYLIPIAVFSLAFSGTVGVAIAFISAAIWLLIEVMTGMEETDSFVHLWNTIIRLGFFLLPALLLRAVEQEKRHARTDFLTGAINNRYLNEVMQREIDRSLRYKHPFTVAFIDLDNFKAVNDTFGHSFGDSLLRVAAESMKNNLRKTDFVARVGGDEFVVLLPETGPEAAKKAVSNLFQKLTNEMQVKKWPITFSVGVLTLTAPTISVDKILSIVDKMMYAVKNNGRNDIKFATHVNDPAPPNHPRS